MNKYITWDQFSIVVSNEGSFNNINTIEEPVGSSKCRQSTLIVSKEETFYRS